MKQVKGKPLQLTQKAKKKKKKKRRIFYEYLKDIICMFMYVQQTQQPKNKELTDYRCR